MLCFAAVQANYTLVALHWFTAVVGPEVWRTTVFELLHLSPPAWLPARLQRAAVNELVTTMVRLGFRVLGLNPKTLKSSSARPLC